MGLLWNLLHPFRMYARVDRIFVLKNGDDVRVYVATPDDKFGTSQMWRPVLHARVPGHAAFVIGYTEIDNTKPVSSKLK